MPVKQVAAKNWLNLPIVGGRRYSTGTPSDPWTPVLPIRSFTTAYSSPSGNTWTATVTANNNAAGTGTGNRTDCGLQYAIDNCALGDIILVTKGATYTGQFTLKYKASGSGYIYICSTGDPGQGGTGLPAAGTRVVEADATSMAKLTGAATNTATIITENNSGFYRLVGLEITTSSTNGAPLQTGVVVLGNGNTSNSTVPTNIIFDRCWIHGSSATTNSGRRGVTLSGEYLAVIDSRVSGFYDDGNDSQALFGYQGDGPFWIVNNYLEAASENILFGGSDPLIASSVPSDITIRHNYFFKPTAWQALGTHNVKNLLEFKNAQRVLVEGNTFENIWAEGQQGFAILLTPRNQDGTAPWCVTKDITIRLNKMINFGSGFNLSGRDTTPGFTTQITERVLIENNLMDVTKYGGADGTIFQMANGLQYLTIQHNTAFTDVTGYMSYTNLGSPTQNDHLRYKNNILSTGATGFDGTSMGGNANNTLSTYYTDYSLTGNAIIGSPGTNYPVGNFYPANLAAVGFTDTSGAFEVNNYALTGGSAYHNAATDGTDIGCDIAALNTALA